MRAKLAFWVYSAVTVSVLLAQTTLAGTITAHSKVYAEREITIRNTSSTEASSVTFTFSGQVTALADATGGGSASVTSFVQFDRVDVPEFLLSDSISAPPSHTGVFSPRSFTFDIAPGGSVVLASVGWISADLKVDSPPDSANALGTGVDKEEFTNNSLVEIEIQIAKRKKVSQYELTLSGADPSQVAALASFSVPGFSDELSANGQRIVPLETSFNATLGPGETVASVHTSTNLVRVSPVPEPSSSILLGLGFAIWGLTRRTIQGLVR